MNYVRVSLFVVCLVFVASICCASPFVVCDPQTGVTHYKVTGAAWIPGNVPAQADGSIKMDIAESPTGTSTLNFVACKADTLWGELCSTSSPFSFTRPAGPQVPANFRLGQ